MDKFLEELKNKVAKDVEVYMETGDEGLLKKIALQTTIIMNITCIESTEATTQVTNEVMNKVKDIDTTNFDINKLFGMLRG